MIDDGNSEDTGGVSREQKPFIFLSYGHDAYSVLAVRLKKDLEAQGYEVWYDLQRLKAGVDWEQYIEEGLEKASRMADQGFLLFLMTHHSARRPDGFCLNELGKACAEGIRSIIPVLVQYGSKPPLSICRLQYLDIQDCLDETLTLRGDKYTVYVKRILEVLRRERPLDTEGGEAALRGLLSPINFSVDRLGHQEFSGREWVFKRIQEWLETDTPKRVLWIKGKAGTGKTGLAIKICDQYEQVVAHHLCKAENQEKKKPENLVKSIAFQLSTQIPEYRERLLDARSGLEDTLSNYKEDPRTLFEKLIVEPLYGLRMDPGVKKVIVIDAVDEANHPYSNDITAFIRDEFPKTPSWLRLILTSRDDPLVNSDLVVYKPEAITLESPDNEKDILHYLEKHLKPFVPEGHDTHAYAEQLAGKSQGMFLYAVEVVKSIRRRELKLEEVETFPIGMNDFYKRNYERRFPPNQPEAMRQYEERVLPLLNVMAAALEPLDKETLTSVLGLSTQKEADRLYQMMGTLFVQTDEWITPVHKSLMDWLVSEAAGAYKIYPMDGHRSLAEYGWKRLKEKEAHGWEEPLDYEIQNLGIHLYGSATNPERDTTIRDRLVGLFSKTFAYEGEGKLPQTVLKNLLDFLVTLRNEEDEIAFKRVLSQFMNNQKGRKNYDSIFRLAIFLRDRSDFYRVHTKPKWGRWLLDYQHTLIEELILSNPEVNEYNHAKAESLNRMGDIFRISGDQRNAMDAYNESYSIMGDLFKRVTDNDVWRKCLFISLGRMGDLLLEQDDPDRALEAYAEIQRQLEKYDDNRWKHYLSVCKRRMGDILRTTKAENSYFSFRKMGEISPEIRSGYDKESEELYRASLKIMEELTADSSNLLWKKDLNLSLRRVAEMEECKINSDMDSALKMYMESKKVIQEMLTVEPDNTEWLHQLGISLHCIARVQRAKGNLDIAARALEESHRILEKLKDCNYRNTELQQDLAVSFLKMGELKEALGETDDSLGAFQEAVKYLEGLVANNPENKSADRWKGLLVYALRKKAEKEQHINRETAVYSYHAALEYLYELYGIDIEDLGNCSNWSNWKTKNVNWYSNMKDYIVILFELGSIEIMSENPSSGNRRIKLAHRYLEKSKDPELIFRLDKFRKNLNKAGFEDNLQAVYENTLAIRQIIPARARAMGDLNKTSEEYRKALDIADEQTAQNPENTEWKQALYESWIKNADIERERGNLDKALEACKAALEIAKGLSTENDLHTGWKYDLWESWNKVAIIECKRGNLSQALEGCKISTRILKELIALDPSQNNLFELQRNTWVLIGESGDKKANENVYLEAFSEAEKCNKPGELGFALTFRKKASIEKARGNNINAKELYEKCLEFAPHSFDIFDIYVELGKIEQILENPLSSLNCYKKALSLFKERDKRREKAEELELLYSTIPSIDTLIGQLSYSLETDPALRDILADGWNRIGNLENKRGQLQKALNALYKDLYFLHDSRKRDRASALLKIAEIERYSNPENSIKCYNEAFSFLYHGRNISSAILSEYKEVLEKLTDIIEQNERYANLVIDIADNWSEIGDFERARKSNEKAVECYRNCYNLLIGSIIEKSSDTEQRILSVCGKIALLYKRTGKKDTAIEWYKLVDNQSRELLARYPNSIELSISVITSLINLYSLSEEAEEKKHYYDEAFQLTNTLTQSGIERKTLTRLNEFFRTDNRGE